MYPPTRATSAAPANHPAPLPMGFRAVLSLSGRTTCPLANPAGRLLLVANLDYPPQHRTYAFACPFWHPFFFLVHRLSHSLREAAIHASYCCCLKAAAPPTTTTTTTCPSRATDEGQHDTSRHTRSRPACRCFDCRLPALGSSELVSGVPTSSWPTTATTIAFIASWVSSTNPD